MPLYRCPARDASTQAWLARNNALICEILRNLWMTA